MENKPSGYAEIESVCSLAPENPAWVQFMVGVLRLPQWMVPAAQEAVRQHRWKLQPNPIGYIKTATYRISVKMGLAADNYEKPPDRSRRCPCGRMFKKRAAASGHTCVAGLIDAFHYKLPDLSGSKDVTGNRYDASDFINIFGCSDYRALSESTFDVVDKNGIGYSGHFLLERINPEFRKLNPPDPSALPAAEDTEYGHTQWNSGDWGSISIDWPKLAKKMGLSQVDATVMKLRFHYGYSRETLLSGAATKRESQQFQTAWRRIAARFDEITALLLHNPEEDAWAARMTSARHSPQRPWETAARKKTVQIPERSYIRDGIDVELEPSIESESSGKGRTLMRDGI